MTRPVHWSDLAVQQLASIALYIGRTSPLYAERMVERILRRVDTLAEFPEIGLRASEAEDENVREVRGDSVSHSLSRAALPGGYSRYRPRPSGNRLAKVAGGSRRVLANVALQLTAALRMAPADADAFIGCVCRLQLKR